MLFRFWYEQFWKKKQREDFNGLKETSSNESNQVSLVELLILCTHLIFYDKNKCDIHPMLSCLHFEISWVPIS